MNSEVIQKTIEIAPYGKNRKHQKFYANLTQEKVLDWVDSIVNGVKLIDGIPVLYVQGGVGSGKTRALLAPVIKLLTEIAGIRILWGRNDFNDLKKSAMETFFEAMPEELIIKRNEQYHWYDIQSEGVDEKSRIYFAGLKDITGLGSQEFGIVVITEVHEISEVSYRTLKQRCRQIHMPLMILMEGNPPNQGHWIQELTDPQNDKYDSDIEMWKISTYENWKNLPKSYCNSLEKMPQSWKSKYLMGEYGFTPDGTPFYNGFKEHLHKHKLSYNTARPLIRSWDYGYRHPAITFHQIDVKGRWTILKEVMGADITILEFGNYIKTLCKEWYPDARWIDYGDPAGESKTDKSEKTSVEILASLGIFVTSKTSTYRERKEIIERRLATLIDGLPSLLVDEACTITIDGFLGGYHYPVRKQGQAYNPNIFEVPYRDGYYEHCVSGNTKIRTLNGWYAIKDLVGKEFITYTYNSFSKRLIPAKAHSVRKTQENVELWKLTFDEGELIATPDHLIMLRDDSYRQLRNLATDDELMPFYEKQRSKKGHTIINLNDGSIVDEHRYIYNWFKGNLRDGYHIHHLDGNPRNNHPDNLLQEEARKHMAKVYEAMRKHPIDKAMRNGSLNPWTKECREKMSRHMKARYRDGNHPLTKRIDKICLICNKVFSATWKQKYCSNCYNKQRNYREKLQLAQLVNHKVISVEFYGYGDTYNLEVDAYHNYPANGIMIHNCMNSIEYFAVNEFQGAETKEASGEVSYKTIGPHRDVKIEYPDDEDSQTNYGKYRVVTGVPEE